MDIREKAKNYTDLSGLMSPHILSEPKPIAASGNGLRYFSEYHILLELTGQSTEEDKNEFERVVGTCMELPGLLKRTPLPKERNDQEQMDDTLAVLTACYVLKRTKHPKNMFCFGIKHLGFFNTQNPGKFTFNGKIAWKAFIWRMPQIFLANAIAAGRYKWYKPWYYPSLLITALLIAFGSKDKPLYDVDARILTRLLTLITEKSVLCRFTSKLFNKYCNKDYPNGMIDVYTMVYGPEHVLTILMKQKL